MNAAPPSSIHPAETHTTNSIIKMSTHPSLPNVHHPSPNYSIPTPSISRNPRLQTSRPIPLRPHLPSPRQHHEPIPVLQQYHPSLVPHSLRRFRHRLERHVRFTYFPDIFTVLIKVQTPMTRRKL
ncbi:hypothetical protein ASPTUDRAFT_887889 [Aspergillus tubingensis CBS 134.48]|uniref:Uncharacterized protein n=1 Tax=Aspergillus tubingensis (strain CBS 134.48) TaxID=767770 RepID=A0A1L9MR56_ASPTC|nr:hypothetical protein ASPTUDRAFT_887889 [Aspergillus tubingensis CBS 134.48]